MSRKILKGIIINKTKDKKTVSVKIERIFKHPLYKKTIKRTKNYLAHLYDNLYKIGDTVKIEESKPFSKKKTWFVKK